MTTMEEVLSLLEMEQDTATNAAKGAANLAWIRLNAFAKISKVVSDKYAMGKAVFEADESAWISDLGNCRHALELLFQEFNRVQYYKNVAKSASSKSEATSKASTPAVEEPGGVDKGKEDKKEKGRDTMDSLIETWEKSESHLDWNERGDKV